MFHLPEECFLPFVRILVYPCFLGEGGILSFALSKGIILNF
ncbi:hypothetical protein BREVNS_1946 [Brevinematales bacterium NS]|nr:hypothetical protein BREVNS_1946 [Brevinematales bacterium NS]